MTTVDPNSVSNAEWDAWEHARTHANKRHAAEHKRPRKPTRAELEAQLRAIQAAADWIWQDWQRLQSLRATPCPDCASR